MEGLGLGEADLLALALPHEFLILGSTFTDTEPQFTHFCIQPSAGVTERDRAQPKPSRGL